MAQSFEEMGAELGKLVASKNVQYGDSGARAGEIFAVLYPQGIQPHQYRDALLMVRVLDKLSRIAQRGTDGKDLGGESPWMDLAGYGLIGWKMDKGPETTPEASKVHGWACPTQCAAKCKNCGHICGWHFITRAYGAHSDGPACNGGISMRNDECTTKCGAFK